MPMYDFQCTQCEHVFEEIVPIEAPPPVCPECGAATEKLLSQINFKVKKKSKKAEVMGKKALEDYREKHLKGKRAFPMAPRPAKKSP